MVNVLPLYTKLLKGQYTYLNARIKILVLFQFFYT
jgi:hypothetical protein